MSPEQITLVRESWARVRPNAEAAAELFYGRLFELDPSLQSLFKGDMQTQGAKLMTMIHTAVNGLSNPEAIVPAVEALGRRHAGYGVEPAHYDTVGAALLWTLEQGLGEHYTGEVEKAWTATYDLLATVMREAAAAAD